jgi:hypothetical protein
MSNSLRPKSIVKVVSCDEDKPFGFKKLEIEGRDDEGYGRRVNFTGRIDETM